MRKNIYENKTKNVLNNGQPFRFRLNQMRRQDLLCVEEAICFLTIPITICESENVTITSILGCGLE